MKRFLLPLLIILLLGTLGVSIYIYNRNFGQLNKNRVENQDEQVLSGPVLGNNVEYLEWDDTIKGFISLSLDKSKYDIDEDIQILLENNSTNVVTLNASVSYKVNSVWNRIYDLECGCNNQCSELVLGAGDSQSLTFNLNKVCFSQPLLTGGDYSIDIMILTKDKATEVRKEFVIVD